MKLIPQNEVEEAAEEFLITKSFEITTKKECFKAGVEFAESKFEKILKEYSEYLGIETDGSLIELFIRKRNGSK